MDSKGVEPSTFRMRTERSPMRTLKKPPKDKTFLWENGKKYEGYGVKRICNYLVENHIMGRNGKNIPTTTLVRMVRNKCYTGYLINGNVEKECPELRIIEQEVFDRAQELRDTRRREKGEDSDSYSPHALLCGKVFCAHCGNRLNITSSGRTRLRADGSTVKEKRFRYSCHYNVRHASFQQRQAILNQFIKEVRVGRDYDIEIILNVPLEEFEEFKSHSLSVRTPSGRKTDLKQAPVRGLGTPNGGIVVFDKTSGEAMNIMPKSSAHVTLRCQDE